MDLKEISKLQDKIEDFNESLLDAKELLIDNDIMTSKILSDLNYKSQVLISSLLNINMNVNNNLDGYDLTNKLEEEQVFEMICNASGNLPEEIHKKSKKRERKTLIPRQVHEAVLHATFEKNLAETGRIYGKNHATVLNSIKIVNNLLDTDSDFRGKYGYILLLCNKINPKTKDKINIHKLSKQL